MGLYLILAIVLTLYHFKRIHLKSTLIFLCIVAGIVIVSYKPLILPKIQQTQAEVEIIKKAMMQLHSVHVFLCGMWVFKTDLLILSGSQLKSAKYGRSNM